MKVVAVENLAEIVEAFKAGQVLVFPNETSYVIGCDATNTQAVERLIAIKQRRADKGLPVLVRSLAEARQNINLNERAIDLAQRYWPGPLNIIGPIAKGSQIVPACHKNDMQAIRWSSSDFIQKVMSEFAFPIVATSANVSGKMAAFSVQAAIGQFSNQGLQPDVIVDAGELPEVPASTMIKVSGAHVDVVRFGGITL